MRWLGGPFHQAALAQKTALDRVGRDEDVRWLRVEMVLRGAKKAETFFGNLQVP